MTACSRSWEAEAVEDGRLAGSDRTSFERHAAACPACAAEVAAFEALRRRLREVAHPDPMELEQRRARLDLLRRAHALQKHERSGVRRALVVACVVGIAAAVVWIAGGRVRPWRATLAPPATSVAGSTFDFVDVAGAAVSSRNEGDTTRAVLSEGVAAFHVERVLQERRFVLSLPDGEIEVRGTRFVVGVREGRTERVEVTEGVVVLRLRGHDDLRLAAGDRWTLSLPAPEGLAPSSGPTPPPTEPAGQPRTADLRHAPAPARAASAPPTSRSARPHVCSLVDDCFAAAMAVFQVGSYAEADPLFASFAHEFPGDARAEDASFLRAVARSRLGDRHGAAALARAYLAAFPVGLRRKEAEELVREGAEDGPR